VRTIRRMLAAAAAAFCIFGTFPLSQVSAAGGAGTQVISPTQGLGRLVAGNQRFQSGATSHPNQDVKRRESLVEGQSPFAVIVSCSDSRVPPEVIFDQGLGDLFVVRVAGNTVTRAGLESIDYAVDHLGSNLIVVLGHDSCGAVKGAVAQCTSKPAAELPEIFSNICPAVAQARKAGGDNLYSKAIDFNVTGQVSMLERSPLFKRRVADGSLKIVGARYHLESGKIEILNPGD
jgi:carbonic anhydrase